MKQIMRFILVALGYAVALLRVAARKLTNYRTGVISIAILALVGLAATFTPPAPAQAAAPTLGLNCAFWHNANNTDTTQYFGEQTSSPTWGDADNVTKFDSTTPTGDCTQWATDIGAQWSMSQYYYSNNTTRGGRYNDVLTLDNYSVLFRGYLKPSITTSTLWLRVVSDDASYLWTGATAVSGWSRTNPTAKHPGLHGTTSGVITPGSISVTANYYYPIRLLFGELGGGDELTLTYNTDNGSTWNPVPSSWLYNQGTVATNDQAAPAAPTSLSLTSGTDSGASATDGITSNTAPVLQGSAEANSTVAIYSNPTSSNSNGTYVGSATASALGAFTYTLSINSSTDTYYYATATDGMGYVSGSSTSFRVRANKITISTGAAGANSGFALATQPVVTLTDGGSALVTATNSLGTVASGTATASAGTATFSGAAVTYASGTLAGSTMTYAATGYFSATETLSAIPASLTVATGTTSAGAAFLSNTLYTTSSAAVTLTPTDLLTQMSTASATTNLYAFGSVTVSNAISSTYTGKALKIATNAGVTINAAVTTANAAFTVLSNADNGSGASGGNINITTLGTITTSGGAVVLAGGDWTATTGYARGTATAAAVSDNAGLFIAATISTGGGAFTGNGQLGTAATDSAGFYVSPGGKIQAGGGNITINGLIDSGSSATGGAFRAVRFGGGGGTPFAEVTTTGAGTINITGKTSKASSIEQAILFEYATVTAVNGNIYIKADTFTSAANGFTFATGDSTISTTGTGNITLDSPNYTTGGDNFGNAVVSSGGTLTVWAPALTVPKNWSSVGAMALNAHGGPMNINGNLSVSGSGNGVTLKATTDIILGAFTVQTNAGPITFWSDTDFATSRGGGIKTVASSSILSGGGDIVLSGGASSAAGLTSSWAKGTTATNDSGVWLGGAVNSGAGNITIRAEENSSTGAGDRAGLYIEKAATVTATGSGTVTLDGKVDSANTDISYFHYGVWIGNADSTNLGQVTSGSGAINIKADASGNTRQNRRGIIFNRGKVSSTSGAITIDAYAGSSTTGTFDFYFLTDNNTVDGGTGAVLLKGNSGAASFLDTASINSNTSVTLQISKPAVNSAKTFTLGGSGDKVIEYPAAATDFAANVDTARFAFGTTSKSIRIGTDSVTKSLTVSSAIGAAGPISLLANSVQFIKTAGLDTSALTGAAILVKARVWIQTDSQDSAAGATKFVTDNGDVTFWTASAGGTDGSIVTGNYTYIDTTKGDLGAQATGGGRITFGGGSASTNGVPTGPTLGGTNTAYGIYIYAYNRFYSGGGDIWMYGKSASGNNHGFLTNSDLVMDAGQGQITLRGDNVGIEWGLSLGNNDSGDMTLISEKTSGTAIDISANSPAYAPLVINRLASTHTAYLIANGGGAINLTGNGPTSYVGVAVDRSQILSSSGKITIDGGASYASLGYQSWGQVYLGSKSDSSYVTSSTADILVRATTYVDSDNTSNMAANTAGDLVIQSSGLSFTGASNWGLTTTAKSLTFGKSGETQDMSLIGAGTLVGPLTVYGGNVNLTGGQTLSQAGAKITVKSIGYIRNGAAATFRTNNAPMIFWADSDGNGAGYISTYTGSNFNSANGDTTTTSTAGGDMIFGGGTTGDANGYPTGYSWADGSYSGFDTGYGGTAKNYYYTGGGNFVVRAKAANGLDAVAFNSAHQLWANGGQINIDGQNTSNGLGIQLQRGGGSTTTEIFSSSATVPAIKFTALSNTGLGFLSGNNQSVANVVNVQATGAGGIKIDGDGGAQDIFDIGINATNLLSPGPITLTGTGSGYSGGFFTGALFNGYNSANSVVGYCALATCPISRVLTSAADINITMDRFTSWNGDVNLKVNTAGKFKFEPIRSTGFAEFKVAGQGLAFSTDCTGVTIGKDQDSDAYVQEFYPNVKIAGPIRLYFGYLNLRGNLETTGGAASEIRLKTPTRVYMAANVSVKTAGGDFVVWTNRDKSLGVNAIDGDIYIESTVSVSTSGGKIWMGGGLDDGGGDASITASRGKWSTVTSGDNLPDGYAVGSNSNDNWRIGIYISSGSTFRSGGGDIFMAGAAGPTGTDGGAHIGVSPNVIIDSGSGRIAMWGRAISGSTSWTQGICLDWGDNALPVIITSDASTADAITIYSDSSVSTNASNRGIVAYWHGVLDAKRGYQGLQILASKSGGGISLTGIGSSTNSGAGDGHGLWFEFTDILAIDGPIKLNGLASADTNTFGLETGWRANGSSLLRLGGWQVAGSTAVGGGTIAVPGGLTTNFTNSSSDITLNVDSVYSWEAGYGTNISTTGNVAVVPSTLSGGLVTATDNFDRSQNTANYRFGQFVLPNRVASFTMGRAGTASDYTFKSDVTSSGAIKLYGGSVGIQDLTTNATSGDGILVKAKGDIVTPDGTSAARNVISVTGASSTAPVMLWSNTDAANGGSIQIGNYTDISTTGAAITLAGSASSSDTSPTGYAEGSTSTNCTGLSLGSSAVATDSVKIASAGGNILLRGKSSYDAAACVGLKSWSGINVNSGTGSITAEGLATGSTTNNYNRHALDFNWTSSATGGFTSTWTSAKTSGTAISFTGSSSGTSNNGRGVLGWAGTNIATISATGGGDIAITGTASTNTTQAVSINYANIYAAGGAINISGGAKQVAFGETGANNIGGSSTTSLAGEITVKADSISIAATVGSAAFKNASKLSLISDGVKFSSAQTLGAGTSITNIGSLQVGLDTNTADVTLNGAVSVGGPINIYGGNLTMSAGLTTTATTGIRSILAKGAGNISAASLTTSGGDITLWSDSDANSTGRIDIVDSSTIGSGGGIVTLAGGADDGGTTVESGRSSGDLKPDGFAYGVGTADSTGTIAVRFGQNVVINSGGGYVFVAGHSANSSIYNTSDGIAAMAGFQVNADGGKIHMYGVSNAASGGEFSRGIALAGASATQKAQFISSNSAADAILLSGDASATASASSSGIALVRGSGNSVNTIIANIGTGGVKLIGRSGSNPAALTSDLVGDGLELCGIAVLAKSGQISLTGTTTAAGSTNARGLVIDHTGATAYSGADSYFGSMPGKIINTVDMATSTSDIVFNLDSIAANTTLNSITYTRNFNTSGTVTIQPADGAQSFDMASGNWGWTFASTLTGFTMGQSGTGGNVSGLTQNAQDLNIWYPVSIAGPISLYGKVININDSLATTSGGILAKGTADVNLAAGTSNTVRKSLTTNGGPITLWSNAGANGMGQITLANYTELSSKAGAITLAGSATATETSPTGYATAGSGLNAVEIGNTAVASDSVKLTTTTGNITVRGKLVSSTSTGVGIAVQSGANITSTSGQITLDGASYQPTGTQGHALYLNMNGGYTSTITTGATTGTAISLSGLVSGGTSTNAFGVIAWLSTGAENISATGGGAVTINGSASNGTADAIALNKTNIYATAGNISLNGGTQRIALGQNASTVIGGTTTAANHTGNVNICAGNIVFSTSVTTVRTSGQFVVEPCSGSFATAQSWLTANLSVAASSVRYGRTGNTADITVSTPLTLTGDLEVIGDAISYGGTGVTSTGSTSDVIITASNIFSGAAPFNAGGNVTVTSAAYSATGALTAGGNVSITATGAYTGSGAIQATGGISVTSTVFTGTGALTSASADGIAVTTTAGNLTTGATLLANTSTTAPLVLKSTGSILVNNNLTSTGGPITLWSDSDATADGAIQTATAATVNSNGGNITLSGGTDLATGYAKASTAVLSGAAGTGYVAVHVMGAINAGGGDITLRGQDNTAIGGGGYTAAVELEKSGSLKTTTGNINIEGILGNALTGAGNRDGVVVGYAGTATTGSNVVSTTTGSISIKGSAASLNNALGYGVYFGATAVSTTTGPITVEALGSAQSIYDLRDVGADISSTSGVILVKTGTLGGRAMFELATAKFTSNGSVTLDVLTPTFTLLELAGTGTKIIEPPTGANSFGGAVSTANVTISSTSTALTIGSSTNTSAVSLGKATSIAGPITVYGGDVTNSTNLTATTSTGSIAISANGLFTNSAAISSAGGNQPTTIKAEKAALTGSITSGTGITQVTGYSSGRTIDMGLTGDTTSTLALTNTELGTITAGTIRVGDSTSGTITVSASITIATAKSATLALRTAGNVTATNSAIITATNLGIAAGGTISLGGNNGVTGNLAIVAGGAAAGSGVSYGSAGNYTAAAVDSITPGYGVGKNISISSAPAVGATEVRYLNQTWSAPPVVTVKDEYGYVISANNLNKTSYTTTVTGSGTPTIAGATPVVSGGTQTFSALNFTTAAGTTALTFTTAGLAAGGTSAVTTGTYDVQGGEPQSIAIAYTSTSAPARKTGFGLTATLKDAGGNTVSGPHATDSITVAVTDGDADASNNAAFTAGNSPATVAGVADFSALALSGKVSTNYTLTFTVTYLDSASVSRTKTATQVVTLTPGDAAKLAVTTQAAGFVNRTNFTTQPAVTIQDADGNTVTSATSTVAVAVTAASGTSTQGLTGTTSVAAVSGVATFAGLGKTGAIGDKTLTFTTGSLTAATQTFTLTYGAANQLAMTAPTTTVNDTVFGTQPIVTIQDEDGNTVANSTSTVTLTSTNAIIGGTLLNSAVAMDAVAGVANFSGKNVKLTGTIGAKNLTATIAGSITKVLDITITYGAANKLSVTRQAAGAVNGVAFTTQPQVTVQDISGNTVDNSTLAISVASSGAVLAGTTPVNAVAGVATFAGLKLTGTATSYTLTFTSGALASDSQPITVTYGAAHHLAVTTPAAGAVNGVAFTTQPVITIQDQSNNTVANLTSAITVSSSGSTLSSNNATLTVNAVAGVATFANALKLTGAASTYTLTYTATALSLSQTQSITVTAGAATQLAVTTQAAGFVNRTDFTTAPAVSIQDANGNLVTTATDSITVSIDSGNLTGTRTVAAVGGVATFTGLGKNGTIGLKTMTFHTGSLTDATQQFTLTFGAAYQLAKTTPAAGFTNAVAFTTQPKITIQDQDANTVATGAQSTQSVVLCWFCHPNSPCLAKKSQVLGQCRG